MIAYQSITVLYFRKRVGHICRNEKQKICPSFTNNRTYSATFFQGIINFYVFDPFHNPIQKFCCYTFLKNESILDFTDKCQLNFYLGAEEIQPQLKLKKTKTCF